MLARPNPLQLPRQRLSPTGLAASGVLHIALVWLLLQVAPVQQAVPSQSSPTSVTPLPHTGQGPLRAVKKACGEYGPPSTLGSELAALTFHR